MSQINTVEPLYRGHQWGREKVSAMERCPLCIGLEFFVQIILLVYIHVLALPVTPHLPYSKHVCVYFDLFTPTFNIKMI